MMDPHEEINRLRWQCELASARIERLEAENAALPELLSACEEALAAIDEAYTSTGHVKVAVTSKQRQRIEAAISKAKGHQ